MASNTVAPTWADADNIDSRLADAEVWTTMIEEASVSSEPDASTRIMLMVEVLAAAIADARAQAAALVQRLQAEAST